MAQMVHRKMGDGDQASALRTAKGGMRKERINTTEDDMETLFPMDENSQWGVMKHPKSTGNITDRRIDTLIGRLPRERAPGHSRMTHGHIKRSNRDKRTARQSHGLIKHICPHPEKVPPECHTAEVTMIPRPNGGKRPTALQESTAKVMHKHMAAVMTSHATGNEDFPNSQSCIGCPEGTAEGAGRICRQMGRGERCLIASLDLANVFNTTDQQGIITGLESLDVPGEIRGYMTSTASAMAVGAQGEPTEEFHKDVLE